MSHKSALKAWIMLVTGFESTQVIQSNQNGPRPIGNYATFKIISNVGKDFDYSAREQVDADNITMHYYNQQETTVDVNIYASNGAAIHSQLGHSGYLGSVRSRLKEDQMVLIRGNTPLDLTGLGDTKWRPRYQADYRFRAGNTITESNKRIKELEISGTIESISGTIEIPDPGCDPLFNITSFLSSASTTVEIGSGLWKDIGALTLSAAYDFGPVDSSDVSMSGFGNAWAADLDMGAPLYVGPTPTTEIINYPSSPGTGIFSLAAASSEGNDSEVILQNFFTKTYYGVTTKENTYTEADVLGLGYDSLINVIENEVTITAGAGQYILYACPTRFGPPTFTVNGWDDGFQAPEIVSITNSKGYTESYYVSRTDHSNLGEITIEIS